jgi:hypothetical protein
MRMILRYHNGIRVEAVLLAANRQQMRVVIEDRKDTVEFTALDGRWFSDTGAAVEIEAVIPVASVDVSVFCSEVYPRTNVAGTLS